MNDMSPAARLPVIAALLLLAGACGTATAQSFCSSDGQPRPAVLAERFINADCETCWADAATPKAGKGELAIDWVLSGSKGDDAPLSAVAAREGLERLQALGRAVPATADSVKSAARRSSQRLRVAHGLPFNGYLGASIELKPAGSEAWTAWLLLVETLPAGTEGSPVERNLVRNALQPSWGGKAAMTAAEQRRRFESRPMSIPAGANPERLRVVGWVQDSRGHIRAIAQSRCAPAAPGG